jgi:hypothetical protein
MAGESVSSGDYKTEVKWGLAYCSRSAPAYPHPIPATPACRTLLGVQWHKAFSTTKCQQRIKVK